MKKVLILSNSSGGIYDFRNELVLELLQRCEVHISVPDTVATDKLKAEGCRIISTHINRRGMNPLQDFRLFLAYRKALDEVRPDVVLTYTIKPNIYGGLSARLKKVPYLVNITGLGTTFERGGLLQKLVVWMYRIALKRSRCVFFQNEKNREIFEKAGIRGEKSVLVNGSGVNLAAHPATQYPGREKPRFLYVGRLMKEKGIEEYLENAKKYTNKAEFGIIGYCEESYEEEVQRLQAKGALNFYGFQTEVNEFYRDADAVIIASYHEGMSNVLLEAAAAARPVLATDIHGCKEAVEDGITGLLFEARSSRALSDAIDRFLAMSVEQREEMGRRGRAKMETEFDRRRVVAAYMKEIETILH